MIGSSLVPQRKPPQAPPERELVAPLRYRISNPFVYFLAALVVFGNFAVWIPEKRMPKKRLRANS